MNASERLIIVAALVLAPTSSRADPVVDALLAAYPAHLSRYDGNALAWKSGKSMRITDGRPNKTFEERLAAPDIKDQFSIPYPLGATVNPPALNEDPGRIRNDAFFVTMYGDCRKGDVTRRLRTVAWLPGTGNETIKMTDVNGVAEKIQAISREIDALPSRLIKYATEAGGYNCRTIAGTSRMSAHGYGAAIDINVKFSDYWQWSQKPGALAWRNRIPSEIVEIFERHGFIWGGKWYHFDTMHFEYRPELIAFSKLQPRAR